jgi:eukaryotic-like serine/threonine-protein kinase
MNAIEDDARAVFLEAVGRSPNDWPAFLGAACGENAELRARVEKLLDAHQQMGSINAGSAISGAETDTRHLTLDTLLECPGSVIGPYKLLQQIGEGGMGVVFMAEQTAPIQRTVALKIIKPGMDTRQVIARFEAERQALAMMDHPNIAKVLDAGTTDSGRPYFVMDIVRGVPITEYCDQQHLSVRERLALMAQVCQAVQHAHHKGIIHRDLKPTNVLVAEYDSKPVPKVIDFGVAKATAQKLTERTVFTGFGQLIGTFEYMSPEQSRFNQLDVDTRSDIYSLGVLLYELLAGSPPFEQQRLREAAFDEVLRIIREDEPPKPSTRLSSSATLPSIAANRQTEPTRLNKDVRGELDWIVMKCLEKDRSRRYESASALATDIAHHLADEPVSAAAPSRRYRFWKFVRRHKSSAIAVSAIAAALLAGIVGTTIGLVGQAHQRAEAERQAAIAEAVSRFQAQMLASADPDRMFGDKVTVLQAVEASIKELDAGKLKDQPLVEAAVRGTIGQTLRSLGRFDEAEPQLRRGLEVQKAAAPADELSKADYFAELAIVARNQGRLQDAESLYRQSLAIRRGSLAQDDPRIRFLLSNLGEVLSIEGKFAEAEPLAREAVALARGSLADNEPELAHSLHSLAAVLYREGNHIEAESLMREAVEINRRAWGAGNPETAMAVNDLATALFNQAKLAEAEPLYRESLAIYRRTLPAKHPKLGETLNNLALLLERQGRIDEAEPLYREALEIDRQSLSADSPDLAACLSNFGLLLHRKGKLDEAERHLREALQIARKVAQPGYPFTANTLNGLADVRLEQGAAAEAEPMFREALVVLERTGTPERWKFGVVHYGLGRSLAALKLPTEAEKELLVAEQILAAGDAVGPPYHGRCVEALVALYGDWNKAEPGKGYDKKAETWKAKISSIKPTETTSGLDESKAPSSPNPPAKQH